MEKNAPAKSAAVRKPHHLTLENRQRAVLTGVSEVLSFDENQVVLLTEGGEAAIGGEGLHVTRLTLEEGQMAVEGKIDSVVYTQRAGRRSLFRRGKA